MSRKDHNSYHKRPQCKIDEETIFEGVYRQLDCSDDLSNFSGRSKFGDKNINLYETFEIIKMLGEKKLLTYDHRSPVRNIQHVHLTKYGHLIHDKMERENLNLEEAIYQHECSTLPSNINISSNNIGSIINGSIFGDITNNQSNELDNIAKTLSAEKIQLIADIFASHGETDTQQEIESLSQKDDRKGIIQATIEGLSKAAAKAFGTSIGNNSASELWKEIGDVVPDIINFVRSIL
ncbi:hypothetical protein [Corynebacterium sp. HMSC073D01]|uniref:hypothetical protein n=1 Tax=Corynebacterium sp. HMSC073D01 TaxID=1739536 RepID=UPI0008A6497C|nr:hypothetical protein [Corynebacterium sp. HMSC073D01]OFO48772.1 hypothetical protein HMPREF3044_08220 [Corynebacterium sp. HMSC073D01]